MELYFDTAPPLAQQKEALPALAPSRRQHILQPRFVLRGAPVRLNDFSSER